MSSDLVEAVGLTKRYRGQESPAVSEVSFTIAAGETVGFLGPNGAGKTTLIKLICGVTAPTSGFVNVVGADPVQDPIRAKSGIGAMHQSGPFDMMLPAIDNLKTAARFRGLRWRDTRPWVLEISEYLGVASVLDHLCFQLSGGQRQRVQLVRALLTVPRLLILDEPSAGLDVVGRRQVEQFVGWLGDEFGVTVLWTTHHIEELERNSSRVMVVDKGKILRFSSPDELVEEFGSSHLLVTVDDAAASSVVARWAKEAGFAVESEGVEVRIHGGKAREVIPELSRHCREADVAITGVTTASDSLEKVFLHMTESDR